MKALISNRFGWIKGLALVAAITISGCATPPPADDKEAVAEFNEINDPLEPTNRVIFKANLFFDDAVLKPLAQGYRFVLPEPARDGIRNALDNLRSPVVLLNDLLQGEWERAFQTVMRFCINTTFGIGGLFDVASDMGIKAHDEDFGQTLAVWGAGEGPFLMLPLFGPSNIRDTVGLVVDSFSDPFTYYFQNTGYEWANYTRTGLTALDKRSRNIELLDELEKTSLDFYSALRNLYRQRRADEIRNGVPGANTTAPGVSFQFDDTTPKNETLLKN